MSNRVTIRDVRRVLVRLARVLGTDKVAVVRGCIVVGGQYDPDPGDVPTCGWGPDGWQTDRPWVLALYVDHANYQIHVHKRTSSGVAYVPFRGRTPRELCDAVHAFEEGLRVYDQVRGTT